MVEVFYGRYRYDFGLIKVWQGLFHVLIEPAVSYGRDAPEDRPVQLLVVRLDARHYIEGVICGDSRWLEKLLSLPHILCRINRPMSFVRTCQQQIMITGRSRLPMRWRQLPDRGRAIVTVVAHGREPALAQVDPIVTHLLHGLVHLFAVEGRLDRVALALLHALQVPVHSRVLDEVPLVELHHGQVRLVQGEGVWVGGGCSQSVPLALLREDRVGHRTHCIVDRRTFGTAVGRGRDSRIDI